MARHASGLIAAARKAADRWLFRIGPVEPAPIVLHQRRIYVLPTAAGLGFAMALLAMLIASINYTLSLGYGLVFLLGGTAVASILHAFRNVLGLAIHPGRCMPVFCGEPAAFRLRIENARPLRRAALCLRAHKQQTEFDIAPADTTHITLACPTRQRGVLALGRTTLETTWPLGFIRAWSVFVPDLNCIVYPRPELNPPALPATLGGLEGGQAQQRSGDDDFAELRTHRIADSPRHVAWKVLARGGPMLTKQFSSPMGADLVLDWSALPGTLDSEQRLSRLTAWLLAAEREGRRYALHLPTHTEPSGCGAPHLQRCLTQLALFGLPDRERRHA